jgi:hypothetical protein
VISVMNTVLDGSGAGWQWCMGVISMTVVVLDGNGACYDQDDGVMLEGSDSWV